MGAQASSAQVRHQVSTSEAPVAIKAMACKCCNDFASSPKCQLGYIAIAAVIIVLGIFAVLHEENNPESETSQARIVRILPYAIAEIAFCLMCCSRFCSPLCCPTDMQDVPPPCPPTKFVCLDCPLLTAWGMATIWICVLAITSRVDAGGTNAGSIRVLRLLRILIPVLASIGIATGVWKFVLMKNQAPPDVVQQPP